MSNKRNITPNHTQIPNEYLDKIMPFLSGAEWKCLSYISRRTFGFQKRSDKISISQIQNGIKNKDGEHLDYGTGLSNRQVYNAIKKLNELKIIKAKKRIGATTEYALKKQIDINILNSITTPAKIAPLQKVHTTPAKIAPLQKVHTTPAKSSQVPLQKVHTQKKGKKVIKRKYREQSSQGGISSVKGNKFNNVPSSFDAITYIKKMKKDKNLHIRIIATFLALKDKGKFIKTKDNMSRIIRRNLKVAQLLAGYDKKIIETAIEKTIRSSKKNGFRWTLETVLKLIET